MVKLIYKGNLSDTVGLYYVISKVSNRDVIERLGLLPLPFFQVLRDIIDQSCFCFFHLLQTYKLHLYFLFLYLFSVVYFISTYVHETIIFLLYLFSTNSPGVQSPATRGL